ncbi:9403_t:CDS:10, partial [Entrophospora sp. SA101]
TTHYNMVANIEQVYHFEKFTPDLAFLGPLYHIFALHFIIHQALYSGASAIILSKFDINSFCHAIQDHKINIIYVVPPIVLKLVKDPAVDNYDLTSLKFLFCAAAPLSEELSNMFSNKFGTPLKQGYGLTETTPIITMDRTDDITIGSSGILIANIEAKIIDESGKELGINEQGELYVRGPNVMKGYLNNKQATKECIGKDGFFRTGDVAFINENGKIFLVDRIKELIKYKGSQVAPAELESVLLTNPIISDAAVVGIYSEQDATELPVAYVVLQNLPPEAANDHQQTKKLIQDHVAEKVAPHKKLRGGVYIIDKIPKSPSGKILRKDLRGRLKSEWSHTGDNSGKSKGGDGVINYDITDINKNEDPSWTSFEKLLLFKMNECIGKDGFFRTGDVAFINENGKIFLVDRIKELIKYKGSQVAPAELESVLLTNPIISDAAVVGIYSEQDATELPVAYVVLQNLPPEAANDHQQTKKLIQDHVAEKVAPHKKLRGGVYIIDKIPKSPSGKILRKDLRGRLKSEWVRPDDLFKYK